MAAFSLIGIRMVSIGIRLQTWMRVILDVDEQPRLSLEITGPCRVGISNGRYPAPGHVPPVQTSKKAIQWLEEKN